jgi:alpha-beta hydrolase superfamily lysophospholipase
MLPPIYRWDLDPVGENAKGVERLLRAYAAANLACVTHRFYDGARHELVNETNRDEVTRDVVAWMDNVIVAPGALPQAYSKR